MTIPVNKISINVFQHETEDKRKIFSGLQYLFPEELHESLEKQFTEEVLTGYHKNNIIKYYIEFHKNKQTQNVFFFIVKKVLNSTSIFEIFNRISDEGELYLRFNKQSLIHDESYVLDNSSDVYKIVIKFLLIKFF